ncbi:hypothetical protein [Liberiplasma polymorphum]|uniref:hypothetical protein n=1 Tax=Liberiplasma polymorphum TaxID=3374570 RepID=UPI003774C001
MSELNFKLYQTPMAENIGSYVLFQAGKGKKNQPSIYIENSVFDFIRGIIWNKYREFGNQKKINQINNDDWNRILAGFKEAVVDLKNCKSAKDIKSILFIPNQIDLESEAIFQSKENIQELITALIEWLETNLKKAKYILIIQNI